MITHTVRRLTDTADTLTWVLSDHLGSASTTANENGTLNSVIQYTAFGEIRLTQGLTPKKYRYTGQLAQAELGLDFYVSRMYDPLTAHFTSADTLIPEPGKSQSWDRFAYVRNNPIRLNDPSGHDKDCGVGDPGCKRVVAKENAENLLKKLANEKSKRTWGQLNNKEQRTLIDVGWDEWTFNHSDYVIPSIKDIGGTVEDPAIWVSLKISTSIVYGPSFVAGSQKLLLGKGNFLNGLKDLTLKICSYSKTCVDLITISLAKQLNYTNTVTKHMQENDRWVPPTIVADTILFGQKMFDPRNVEGAMKYSQEIYAHSNLEPYTLEVIFVEAKNLILHIVYHQ